MSCYKGRVQIKSQYLLISSILACSITAHAVPDEDSCLGRLPADHPTMRMFQSTLDKRWEGIVGNGLPAEQNENALAYLAARAKSDEYSTATLADTWRELRGYLKWDVYGDYEVRSRHGGAFLFVGLRDGRRDFLVITRGEPVTIYTGSTQANLDENTDWQSEHNSLIHR